MARHERRIEDAARHVVATRTLVPYSGRVPPNGLDARGRHVRCSRWTRRAVLAVGALSVTVLGGVRPSAADEPGESTVASELVRQAIALIVSTPGDMEAIEEKVGDALEVDDQKGVDISLVRRAGEEVDAGNMHEARSLLERSIGARPHLGASDVAPIGEVSADDLARGAEAGEAPILDPLDTGDVDGGDTAAIAVGVALLLAGGFLGLRWRPSRVKRA